MEMAYMFIKSSVMGEALADETSDFFNPLLWLLKPAWAVSICTSRFLKWLRRICFTLSKVTHSIDGNKRVEAATALVFLKMNSIDISVSNDVLVQLVLDVVQGNTSKTRDCTIFCSEFLRLID